MNDVARPKAAFVIKHATYFIPCRNNVVDEIPLRCGAVSVGQTGRCLREGAYALRVDTGSPLVSNCKACGYTPLFESTKILKCHLGSLTHESFEAYTIGKGVILALVSPPLHCSRKNSSTLIAHVSD